MDVLFFIYSIPYNPFLLILDIHSCYLKYHRGLLKMAKKYNGMGFGPPYCADDVRIILARTWNRQRPPYGTFNMSNSGI